MGEQTAISWTDSTINVWHGCHKVSAGCANCYAQVSTPVRVKRAAGLEVWGANAARSETKGWAGNLRKWNRAVPMGRTHRVFGQSLSDTFEDYRDGRVIRAHERDDVSLFALRARFFEVIEQCPALTFQLLTKRPENVTRMVPPAWLRSWPAHVWIGATVEDQENAERRIPHLLRIPAPVRFLSVEPQIGPVDVSRWLGYNPLHAIDIGDRNVRVRSRESGPLGDRERRHDLEGGRGTAQQMEQRRDRREGRQASFGFDCTAFVEVHDDQDQAAWEASHGGCASSGLPALLRPNPAGPDREPQERDHDRQSAGKSGTGHVRGADEARDRSSRATPEGSERRRQRYGEAHREGGSGDSTAQDGGGATQEHRGELWGIGPNDLKDCKGRALGISWLICGGESGPKARPFDLAWARSLRDQCRAAGVAFFLKQIGAKPIDTVEPTGHWDEGIRDSHGADEGEWPEDLRDCRAFPEAPR